MCRSVTVTIVKVIGNGIVNPENKALKSTWHELTDIVAVSATPSWIWPAVVSISTREAMNKFKIKEQTQKPEVARGRHDSKYLNKNVTKQLKLNERNLPSFYVSPLKIRRRFEINNFKSQKWASWSFCWNFGTRLNRPRI